MAQIVSDNFTRANALTLGANWTAVTGQNSFGITSNQAVTDGVSAHSHANYFSGAGWTGGNDQYAELTVQANPAANDGGPTVRSATAAQTFYVCDINNADTAALGTSQHVEIFAVSAGTFTLIGSTATLVVSAGDIIRVEAQGTTIRGLVNGVQKASGTNSALASGKVGLQWWGGTGGIAAVSLWTAGDFSSGSSPIGTIPRMFHPGKGTLAQARFYQTRKGVISGPNAFTQLFTAAVSFVGAEVNQTSHILPTAALNFVGAIAKRTNKPLTAALTFSGNLVKAIVHILVAALTFVGNTSKQTVRALTAALTFIGAVVSAKFFTRLLTAAVTFSGAISKQANKSTSGAVTFIGNIPARAITHGLTASLTFIGNTAKQTSRSFTAGLTFIGSLIEGIFKQVFLTAAVSFAGTMSRQTGKALPAALTFTGNVNRAITHNLAAAITFIGNTGKRTTHSFTAAVSFIGAVAKQAGKTLTGAAAFIGNLAANFIAGSGGILYTKALTATVSFTGSVGKGIRKGFIASLGTIGSGIGPPVILLGQRLAIRLKGIIYQWLD